MNCLDLLPVSRASESKGIPENGRTWSVDPQCVCHTVLVAKLISLGEPVGYDSFAIHDRSQRVLFRYPCIPIPVPCLGFFVQDLSVMDKHQFPCLEKLEKGKNQPKFV